MAYIRIDETINNFDEGVELISKLNHISIIIDEEWDILLIKYKNFDDNLKSDNNNNKATSYKKKNKNNKKRKK